MPEQRLSQFQGVAEQIPALTLEKRAIPEWRKDERPRERLLKNGAHTLSDAELLAILIKTGTKGHSALDVAKVLLQRFGSLTALISCDVSILRGFHGMGDVKAITLAAAFELSRRIQSEPFDSRKSIRSPEDLAGLFIPRLRGIQQERFYVILLNTAHQIIREVLVSEGILNASLVHPREVFRMAIAESAASVILLHNHPSGNPEPSAEDLRITRQLVQAGAIMDISVHDHIIIAGETFTSFVARGLMPKS